MPRAQWVSFFILILLTPLSITSMEPQKENQQSVKDLITQVSKLSLLPTLSQVQNEELLVSSAAAGDIEKVMYAIAQRQLAMVIKLLPHVVARGGIGLIEAPLAFVERFLARDWLAAGQCKSYQSIQKFLEAAQLFHKSMVTDKPLSNAPSYLHILPQEIREVIFLCALALVRHVALTEKQTVLS